MESNRVEYKRELTDGFEREAIAFLNYRDGGVIYIGIDKHGSVVGIADCDAVQLAIKDRLKNNILPSCLGLFDVIDLLQIKFEQPLDSIHSCTKQQLNYNVIHNDDDDCDIVQLEF